jgi:hypothetical protein
MGWTMGFDSRYSQDIFIFSTAYRSALGPTQPPIQWEPGAISLGESGRGVKLTIHLHLVSESIMVEKYLHGPTRFRGVVLN